MNDIKLGDTFKNGTVIGIYTQKATQRGANGYGNMKVKKEFVGRKYAIVQFSDKSTQRYWL